MEAHWRDRTLYPILGILSILFFLYLNSGLPSFSFPALWLPTMGFIGTNSTHFVEVVGQRQSTIYVNGWNSYWLMEESIWGESRHRVSRMLRKGAEMGMSVCRTWAFSDGGDASISLQISPGVFNERVLKVGFVNSNCDHHQNWSYFVILVLFHLCRLELYLNMNSPCNGFIIARRR